MEHHFLFLFSETPDPTKFPTKSPTKSPSKQPTISPIEICQSLIISNGPNIFNGIYIRNSDNQKQWKSRTKRGYPTFKIFNQFYFDTSISQKWIILSLEGKLIFQNINQFPLNISKITTKATFGLNEFDVTVTCYDTKNPTSNPTKAPTVFVDLAVFGFVGFNFIL